MIRLSSSLFKLKTKLNPFWSFQLCNNFSSKTISSETDVVIIGGGTIGLHTLYFLSQKGINAVLLERAKLTSGTTWHTNGALWRLRPNDVDIQLLGKSFETIEKLRDTTDYDPGYINNGGIFIAHNENRLNEYRRLSTMGNLMNIENYMLTADEICHQLFPLLDPDAFIGGLWSPGDGCVDPAMLCTSLTKNAQKMGGQIYENCPVTDLLVEDDLYHTRKVTGVKTPFGDIKAKLIVNATGVWARDLIKKYGSHLPVIPMKHSFIVSETILGLKGLPNVRDHDESICFRIQGSTICLGGYENNPILLDSVPNDFEFQLFDLDWSTFEDHVNGASQLCPAFGRAGIKSTVCGPESFTPDHKPLMGPDPYLDGLFHICGFNSAGIMYGGGCANQLVHWMIHGKPELHMYNYDVRRFTDKQRGNSEWAVQRSHEAYATNYHTVFLHAQPMGARNFHKDPLHDIMISKGAVMEEKLGWERPGFFLTDEHVSVPEYDWQGSYGHEKNDKNRYREVIHGDSKYSFSDHHYLIMAESLECRKNAVLFNLSSKCKLILHGPQAKEAADWIFSADTDKEDGSVVYTCALNNAGGIEAQMTVTGIAPGPSQPLNINFANRSYYIVADGDSAYQTLTHIRAVIKSKKFDATVKDVSEDFGIISVQGRNSKHILQRITHIDSNHDIDQNKSDVIDMWIQNGNDHIKVRVHRTNTIGELGYEIHIPNAYCALVYKALNNSKKEFHLSNAGYRALNSLSCESGHLLWDYDIRSDDTPIEANLSQEVCRTTGEYNGKSAIERQLQNGVNRRLVYLTIDNQVPIWGLESVYRNGEAVGYLRRAEFGYFLNKSIGKAYISKKDKSLVDESYLESGDYEIEVLGRKYSAKCYLESPFQADYLD